MRCDSLGRLTWAVATAIVVASLLVLQAGCGGGNGGGAERVLRGIVNETNFVVEAGERVRFDGDVTVQCQTAQVDGELFAQDAAGAGTNGGSLIIQAEGNIAVIGRIRAGDGTNGSSNSAGGVGGSVTLASAGGDITLGGAAVVAGVHPRQADGAGLQSGNGGNGGDGTLGGAGGNGGDIALQCLAGTLRLTPAVGMFTLGNGGSGGTGLVSTAQLDTVVIPATLTNTGGNGGRFTGEVSTVVGVALTSVELPEGGTATRAELPDGVVVGAEGGDAGSSTFGDDPGAAARSVRLAGLVTPREGSTVGITGAKGGNGWFKGGDAALLAYRGRGTVPGGDGTHVTLRGGEGGGANCMEANCIRYAAGVLLFGHSRELQGGSGGAAVATGGDGGSGAASQDGGAGGGATATGGVGGDAFDMVPREQLRPGAGGRAQATGGCGGDGGNGDAASRGGNGGVGGEATATGGPSGRAWADRTASGGDARAVGGNGGNGGNGHSAGTGGGGGAATATGGLGTPNGSANRTVGTNGANGTEIEPPPGAQSYSVAVSRSGGDGVYAVLNWYGFAGVSTRQVQDPFYLPYEEVMGENMYMSASRQHLWAGTMNGLYRVDDPLGAHTVGPTYDCSFSGSVVGGPVWVDEGRDLLYCALSGRATVAVWQGVSAATVRTASLTPVRTFSLTGYELMGLAGDAQADRLFLRAINASDQHVVLVVDNASSRSGNITASRTMTGLGSHPAGLGLAIAHSRQHDILYVGLPQAIGIITSAATANGAVSPRLVTGGATGIVSEPVSMDVYGNTNVLFVADNGGATLAFENASTLSGSAACAKSETIHEWTSGLVTWPEPAVAAASVARR
ncbi:hypothetical protein LLH23_15650 [bacterium]|nr:hypothetical protein [bacterium]